MESLKKLINSSELLSIILNNAFDSIACYAPVKNEAGEIIDFNFIYLNDSALSTIYGRKEDYLGKSFLSLFPYAATDGMFDMFKKTTETGSPMEENFYYEHGNYKGWYRDSAVSYGDVLIVYFRDVTEQKELEIRLKKLVKEKDILLKETHHRVKNNLQVISSLMNLQGKKFDNPKYFDTCLTCKQRVMAMANIHQRLYEDQDFQSVNIKAFVKEMITSAKSNYDNFTKKINLVFDVDDVRLNLNSSVNLGLIINELLTNSIKYAFDSRDTGSIKIEVKQTDHSLRLCISDDGKGLPENFDIQKSESLGFLLVQSLVDQMEGEMVLDSSAGTKIIITLPNVLR
jgi:two-component sensor histidine kinase